MTKIIFLQKFWEKKFLVKKYLKMIMSFLFMILILNYLLIWGSINLDDFNNRASDQEIVALSKAGTEVSKILGISTDTGKGYRALTNLSEDGGQEVPHLHFHLFGGEKIGKMVEWQKKFIEVI